MPLQKNEFVVMSSTLVGSRVARLMSPLRGGQSLRRLRKNMLEVRNLGYLKQALGWTQDANLDFEHLHRFDYYEDLNERRIRDAEVIGTACANNNPKTILEIGTCSGQTTALMATNAPKAEVYTVNIPPEEISDGGKFVTCAISRDDIGIAYRERGLTNVHQIYANTAHWEPDMGPIDVAFIDGCHDADFVYSDTKKILPHCRPGSIILWHDINLDLIRQYRWIAEAARGIERLLAEKLIRGRILHLQDSWVGLYRVPEENH